MSTTSDSLSKAQVELLAERWLAMAEELRTRRDVPGWGVPGVVAPVSRASWADHDKADAYEQCAVEIRELLGGKVPG